MRLPPTSASAEVPLSKTPNCKHTTALRGPKDREIPPTPIEMDLD